jgi:general stress protein YciG
MKCKAHRYTEKTGKYLDRSNYDTPGSIRGCNCPDCVKVRELYKKFKEKHMSEAASILGRKGGQAKSERKTLAVRENGKKGGRPTMETKTWVVLNNENGAFFGTVKAKTWKKALTEAYDAFSPDRRFTLDVISEAEYREKERL